jgi:DeoR family suf operon transcriptional repressor
MKTLHENQRKVLEFLLERPEGATLEEIADRLGITKTAAKEHVIKVTDLGYLTYQDTRGLVGRPRRRYLLSDEGAEAFPRQYSWLSTVLLEQLGQDLGPAGLSRLMGAMAKNVAAGMSARFELSGPALLAEVAKALSELGYRATLKQSDLRKGAVIEATNCVYHAVAKKHPELCQFDTQFIRSATRMEVRLESCIARGGSVCRFCIKPAAKPV